MNKDKIKLLRTMRNKYKVALTILKSRQIKNTFEKTEINEKKKTIEKEIKTIEEMIEEYENNTNKKRPKKK